MPEANIAFVVSQIGAKGSPERKLADDWLSSIVEPVCRKAGILPVRADKISAPGRIDAQISKHLLDAVVVIADLTGLNPNVMYEVGVRHALELPVVHMAAEGQGLPFDFHTIRTLFYDPSFHIGSVEKTKLELAKSVTASIKEPSNSFIFDSGHGDFSIEGSWEVRFDEEDPHRRDITLELRQKGDRIWGTSRHVKKSDDIPGDTIRTYAQKGQIYNKFVHLNGKSPTPQRLLINSFLLEVVGDGQAMKGGVLAYSTVTGDIFSKRCTCVRIG